MGIFDLPGLGRSDGGELKPPRPVPYATSCELRPVVDFLCTLRLTFLGLCSGRGRGPSVPGSGGRGGRGAGSRRGAPPMRGRGARKSGSQPEFEEGSDEEMYEAHDVMPVRGSVPSDYDGATPAPSDNEYNGECYD